jgi:carboxymethylenebutenolidase
MGLTGVLSEDEFVALHELKTEDAPPARGEMIDLAGSKAYLSLPEGAQAPMPAIVVIHEWWGLNQHIKYWADRLAADGYAALAVDLYAGQVATTPEEAMSLMKSVDEGRAKEIIQAAHAYLAQEGRIGASKRGSIGWCFGGGWSLQTAMGTPDLDAAVVYYGHLVDDPEQLEAISAPMMGVFGNLDTGIPPASVDAFEKAMADAGKPLELHRYDANHAFANPSSARYDHEAAAQAWKKTRAFFAKQLKGE